MNARDERILPLGTHLIHIDGDSLVLITRGQMTLDDMKGLIAHFVDIKREHGHIFVLYDGRQCTGMDAAGRKLASGTRREDADAVLRVAFGLPFTVYVMLKMLLHAQKVLVGREVAVHLFEHEKDARAFFEKERERLRRELGSISR